MWGQGGGSPSGFRDEGGRYLVDATQGGHVHGLSTDCAGAADAGRVLAGSGINDGVNQDLQGILPEDGQGEKSAPPAPKNSTPSTLLTSPVSRWMISKACLTIRTVINFLPLLRPCIIMELVSRSTMGHWAFRKRLAA